MRRSDFKTQSELRTAQKLAAQRGIARANFLASVYGIDPKLVPGKSIFELDKLTGFPGYASPARSVNVSRDRTVGITRNQIDRKVAKFRDSKRGAFLALERTHSYNEFPDFIRAVEQIDHQIDALFVNLRIFDSTGDLEDANSCLAQVDLLISKGNQLIVSLAQALSNQIDEDSNRWIDSYLNNFSAYVHSDSAFHRDRVWSEPTPENSPKPKRKLRTLFSRRCRSR
jgi:hypothetical protein